MSQWRATAPRWLTLRPSSISSSRWLNKYYTTTATTSFRSPPSSLFNTKHKHSSPHQRNITHNHSCQLSTTSEMASATSFYDFKPLDKRGQEVPLGDYKGKVVLIVNTASKCGFTPQYAGLEKLWTKLKEQYPEDFVILGFPCNQFGGQEPGTDDDIQEFCQLNYGVTFPIMQKTEVNGDNTNPLWAWLKDQQSGLLGLKRIKWNFEKFLVGRDGKVKGRWASTTKPESLEEPILKALAEKTEA